MAVPTVWRLLRGNCQPNTSRRIPGHQAAQRERERELATILMLEYQLFCLDTRDVLSPAVLPELSSFSGFSYFNLTLNASNASNSRKYRSSVDSEAIILRAAKVGDTVMPSDV